MIWIVGGLGLVVGFLAGVAFDDALDLYRSSRKERPMSPTRNHNLNRWLLLMVLLVNAIVGGALIYQRAVSAEFTSCTAQWQSDFATVYRARSDAVASTQGALDELLEEVRAGDQTGFQRELRQYQKLRAAQVAERKANPLPPLPERVCGEPTR